MSLGTPPTEGCVGEAFPCLKDITTQLLPPYAEHPPMNRGFSLPELLVALALSSLMLAVSIPSIARWNSHRVLVAEGARLTLALENAYIAALSYGVPVTVSLKNNRVRAFVGESRTLATYAPHAGVVVANKSVEQGDLSFYPTHTATPATLTITSSSGECSIIVSLRGRMRSTCA